MLKAHKESHNTFINDNLMDKVPCSASVRDLINISFLVTSINDILCNCFNKTLMYKSIYKKCCGRRSVISAYSTKVRVEGSLNPTFMLTVIYGRQVDGFRPDRAQLGRHFQPQLVAVHPQRLDGADFLPGADLQASRSHLPHFLTRSFPLLHHIAGQISPPAVKTK